MQRQRTLRYGPAPYGAAVPAPQSVSATQAAVPISDVPLPEDQDLSMVPTQTSSYQSPTKDEYRQEMRQLRETLAYQEHETWAYAQHQSEEFQHRARQYHEQTKDLTQAEVATGEARVASDMQSAMTNRENTIINEARQALDDQRKTLADEATQIIEDQRRKFDHKEQLIEDSARKHKIILETEAHAYVGEMHTQAEAALMKESKYVQQLKTEIWDQNQQVLKYQQTMSATCNYQQQIVEFNQKQNVEIKQQMETYQKLNLELQRQYDKVLEQAALKEAQVQDYKELMQQQLDQHELEKHKFQTTISNMHMEHATTISGMNMEITSQKNQMDHMQEAIHQMQIQKQTDDEPMQEENKDWGEQVDWEEEEYWGEEKEYEKEYTQEAWEKLKQKTRK